jgi:RNA polymerase sigma-70 factor (ECF subfamily)
VAAKRRKDCRSKATEICKMPILGVHEVALGDQMQGDPAVATVAGEVTFTLAQRIRDGDRLAEEELVSTYRRGVFAIASARTRDREAAQDLTQEVLIAVFKALREDQLREPEKLAAFVHGTARNVINNYLRVRVRRAECELDPAAAYAPNLVEELESAERRRLMRLELESFSLADQQILLLSLVDGHTLVEVAQRLSMSHDAVRARKSRLLRKITKKFERMSQRRASTPLT